MKTNEMLVSKIKEGTVIDRIPAGKALKCVSLLKVEEDPKTIITIGMRVHSDKVGMKDIVKIHGRFLTENEKDALALFIPGTMISYIEDYNVSKKEYLETPDEVTDVLVCNNPTCATNYREPVVTKFTIMQKEPILARCLYCDRVMLEKNIMDQF